MHKPECGGQHTEIGGMAVGIHPMAPIVPMVRAERWMCRVHALALHAGNGRRCGLRHRPRFRRANVSRNRCACEEHRRNQQERKQPRKRGMAILHESLPTSVFTLAPPKLGHKEGTRRWGL